jgi:hypothetical protein
VAVSLVFADHDSLSQLHVADSFALLNGGVTEPRAARVESLTPQRGLRRDSQHHRVAHDTVVDQRA